MSGGESTSSFYDLIFDWRGAFGSRVCVFGPPVLADRFVRACGHQSGNEETGNEETGSGPKRNLLLAGQRARAISYASKKPSLMGKKLDPIAIYVHPDRGL